MAATLWIDVEDLFEYARANPRPSGIQRVAFELCQALRQVPAGGLTPRFVRHASAKNSLAVVEWENIVALYAGLTDTPNAAPPPPAPRAPRPRGRVHQFARRLSYRLPFGLRHAVNELARTQIAALQAWVRLARALVRAARTPRGGPGQATVTGDAAGFAAAVRPEDWLLVLGAPWGHPHYGTLIEAMRQRHGLRCALLVYDLIPLRFPEFCAPDLVRIFRAWVDDILPRCSAIFAISRATAADTEARLRELAVSAPPPVLPLPMGTGFGDGPAAARITARVPTAGSYALIVGTIEARKNHLAAFRAWRRLLGDLPAERVPTLVFAGRPGWMVADLMQQIANTDYLNGKLVLIADPTDAEISALYQGCLFTLFPSYAEGWGLPVSESLAFGKPCLCADRTSLPEAGMGLARLFDPDDLNDLVAKLRTLLETPDELADWTAQVRSRFQPVPWSATARALLDGLPR